MPKLKASQQWRVSWQYRTQWTGSHRANTVYFGNAPDSEQRARAFVDNLVSPVSIALTHPYGIRIKPAKETK